MGAAMARSCAREGHDVTVWNRTRSKADEAAGDSIAAVDTVAEAVRGADVVVTMLYDTDSVLAVTDELVGSLGREAVWVQSSTVGPDGTSRIQQAAGSAADRLLDAPVLGTRKPAEDGALVVLLSGPAASREAAEPVLAAIGSRTVTVGDDLGTASALKLVANSWVALVNAGTAQALAMAESFGLDPELFLDAVDGGAVDAPYVQLKGALMLQRDWTTPSFALDGVVKDVALMRQEAGSRGFPTDLLDTLAGLYDRASQAGEGGSDMAAVKRAFEAG